MALRREAREADSFFEEDQSLEGEGDLSKDGNRE